MLRPLSTLVGRGGRRPGWGLLVLFLTFCQSTKVLDEKTGRAAGAKTDGPSGYYFDDMARYLGGFDIPSDSKLAPFTQGPEYAQHRNSMAVFWEKTRAHSITPVSEWRETTLFRNPNGTVCREDRPAIYPMSGADLINLYNICPYASEYVMVALEKAGDIPHPENQTAQYYRNLSDMRAVIGNIAQRNYFSSVFMRAKIVNNREIPGIAPVLLAFALAMTGFGLRRVRGGLCCALISAAPHQGDDNEQAAHGKPSIRGCPHVATPFSNNEKMGGVSAVPPATNPPRIPRRWRPSCARSASR